MSMEYTIDIQLTELGFPDILQSQEAESTCHTTLSDDDSLSSHSSTSVSKTTQQKRRLRGPQSIAGKEVKREPTSKAVSLVSGVLDPVHERGHIEADEDSVAPALSESTTADPINEDKSTLLGNDPEEDGGKKGADRAVDIAMEEEQNDDDDDSGDSEVSDVYEEEEIDDEEDDEEEQNSDTGEHHCTICDLTLPSKFKLQDHMNLHTGARPYCCAECGKRFCQIYNYRVHLRTHAKAKVELQSCRICLKVFTSERSLKTHLARNHFEDKFYECDLCKRVFTTLKDCEHHVQLHKCMSTVCEQCGRTFATQKALKRHRRGTKCHSSFKCTDCPKTFTKKNALLKHSFSHLGLLPYTCIRCHCHFRLAKLYRQHKCKPERIHCVACLREFLSQSDFQQHKKDTGCWGNQEPKGDEIRCLECGQGFETAEELKQHAGAHQRVLKCAECGKGFRSALLLMSHMGGHVGQSPCLCQRCGLGFPHQQNYDSHLKTCGKTPQPVKHQSSKSSSDKKKTSSGMKKSSSSMHNTTQMSTSNEANAVNTSAVANYPTAPAKDSWSPDQVTGGVSGVNSSSDRLWKITLDKEPPPGMKLVLFLPVCSTESTGVTIPTTVTQTLQAQSSPVSSYGHIGGALLDTPMDLVSGIKQGLEREEPLDLSKKCTSSESAVDDVTLRNIKREPEEDEVSGETERQKIKSNTEATHFVNIKDLSSHGDGASHAFIINIKEEPQSPSSDLHPSTSCQLSDWKPDKEIKMEVDLSHPTCPGTDQ